MSPAETESPGDPAEPGSSSRHSAPEVDPAFAWVTDPELVAIYDVENSGGWDHEFYLELAQELGAARVADIGCGTGVFGILLAEHGIEVTGVDPAAAMIDVARSRTAESQLTPPPRWIHGFADQLEAQAADLVVMEGHVAQYFLTRADWEAVLDHAFQALRPGGHLAFEVRNPAALELDAWDPESTRETQPHPDGGEFTSWMEIVRVTEDPADGALITARAHNILPDSRELIAEETLRYRPLSVLRQTLSAAGFRPVQLWGDWDREELSDDSPEMIFLVQRPD
ncbi:class I SAM-dependent methyltransferase [Nesterenkonia sp. LB17]|uniref:class I SAM-dependent methyltransferase n=1 Tax=unclassified Nesterenkonia TaxID=2629769 RepID=UPI001F4CAE44|nr:MULTISPECIES: class I SAM-dependent methyltransferase [unclassified Nesterenkonia]MCH8562881.1 class I SAM-dependent methyltransferase [Nesterenkonia sp. YGD6]MCH8565930.1 class I SAM-dependent methyltransferase [Nesterenkonia sp. LB17]